MMNVKMADRLLFFYKFLQSPKEVGSVIPSSRFLSDKVMEQVNWQEVRAVAELGAGTGVFTQAIEQRMHPDCQAIIFEQDPQMRHRLACTFPQMNVCRDAQEITRELNKLEVAELDCIISGLPFANFSQELRDRILDEAYAALKPGGVFVTFQYSLQMRSQLKSRFSRVNLAFAPWNVPPAFVYICHK